MKRMLTVLAILVVMLLGVAAARADECVSPAGCNRYGCWQEGGGCNAYGCWSTPGAGCNQYGCWQSGGCNQYGCWQ